MSMETSAYAHIQRKDQVGAWKFLPRSVHRIHASFGKSLSQKGKKRRKGRSLNVTKEIAEVQIIKREEKCPEAEFIL